MYYKISHLKNFKEEILKILKIYNKTSEDIYFVTDNTVYCSFDEFLNIIQDYEYPFLSKNTNINPYLKIVGNNWWIERKISKNLEYWIYKSLPQSPFYYSANIEWKNKIN